MVRKLDQKLALMLASLLLVLLALPSASAIDFDMVFQTKCVFEEIMDIEVPVAGSYSAVWRDRPEEKVPVTLRIENPNGEMIFEKKNMASGDFAIPAGLEGEYRLCFAAKDYVTAQNTRISLKWKEGFEATDWQAVAKKDNLDSVHTELLRLEDEIHTIHIELQHIRRKEEEMRDVNERTNARVAWCSIGALITCVTMAALQVYSLRRFLIRKKVL